MGCVVFLSLLCQTVVSELTLLCEWVGTSPDLKPILLLAHQDVVRGTVAHAPQREGMVCFSRPLHGAGRVSVCILALGGRGVCLASGFPARWPALVLQALHKPTLSR